MKRISFKPFGLFPLLVLGFPALAQTNNNTTPPVKTPIEQLQEATTFTPVEVSSEGLANLAFTGLIVGKSFLLQHGAVPKVCADHMELSDVKVDRPAEADQKKFSTLDELKAASSKVHPVVIFKGVPAVPDLASCFAKAGAMDKVDITKDARFSRDVLNDDEKAYVDFGHSNSKSAAYIKIEKDVNLINCSECNKDPAAEIANMKALSASGVWGEIIAKMADEPIDKYIDLAEAAKTDTELLKIGDALVRYAAVIKDLSIPQTRKDELRKRITDLLTQGLPAKSISLGAQQSKRQNPFDLWGTSTSSTSTDLWAKFRSSGSTTVDSSTVAAKYANCAAQLMEKASPLIADADDKKSNMEIAKQLRTKGSDIRTETIAQMDPANAEVKDALVTATVQFQAAQAQLSAHCSRIYNDFQFTQCGMYNDQYKKTAAFLQTYGQRYQAATAQDQLVFDSYGMGFSRTGVYSGFNTTGNQQRSNPFALSSAVYPDAVAWNSKSGMNYQNSTFDPSLLYKPASDWNRMQAPVQGSNAQLPVAIPLNASGFPVQQLPRNQFQT